MGCGRWRPRVWSYSLSWRGPVVRPTRPCSTVCGPGWGPMRCAGSRSWRTTAPSGPGAGAVPARRVAVSPARTGRCGCWRTRCRWRFGDGRPWLDGALDLGLERERIDIGWWDDFEVARDYFAAGTPPGERVWVYREIRGRRGWFLHGLFG